MDDILDRQPLSELAFLGSERFGHLVESYAASAAKQLSLIGDALDGGDCEAAWRGAHNLRGASLIFGAQRVAKAAADLELAATAGQVADCCDHYDRLRRGVERAVSQLRTLAIESFGS